MYLFDTINHKYKSIFINMDNVSSVHKPFFIKSLVIVFQMVVAMEYVRSTY